MAMAWSDSVFLTRQQIGEIAHVSDGTLAFWLKNGLLKPASGGEGRGSHKKFKPIQATFAAMLGELHKFGMNISKLKSFSEFLERGVEICERTNLHPFSITSAACLKRNFIRFNEGEKICVGFEKDEKGENYPDLRLKYADTIEDIEADFAEQIPDYDPAELIIQFAHSIPDDAIFSVEAYADIRGEMNGEDVGDTAWLIWQHVGNTWAIGSQNAPGEQFTNQPDVNTAIFLALGRVIRRTWGLDVEQRRKVRRQKMLARMRRANPVVAERLKDRWLREESGSS